MPNLTQRPGSGNIAKRLDRIGRKGIMKPIVVLASASLVLTCVLPQSSLGIVQPKRERLPDFDKRMGASPSPNTAARTASTSTRGAAVMRLKAKLPAAQVDFNELTGVPSWIHGRDGFLTGPGGGGAARTANVVGAPAGDLE